jgi:hypothetical protein
MVPTHGGSERQRGWTNEMPMGDGRDGERCGKLDGPFNWSGIFN